MLISSNAQKILKTLHLLAVSCWVGGCITIIVSNHALQYLTTADQLYGALLNLRFVTFLVVVYLGAFGSFFTGLAYSLCTNRGFFRHKWIIIKWVITVYIIFAGIKILAPLGVNMLETTHKIGIAALQDNFFKSLLHKHLVLQLINLTLFIISFLLSVYKPWEAEESYKRYQGNGQE